MNRYWEGHCSVFRCSRIEVFLEKSVLKICSKFTGEHPRRGAISIKLQSNYGDDLSKPEEYYIIIAKLIFPVSILFVVSKQVFQKKQSTPNFPKNEHFLPP